MIKRLKIKFVCINMLIVTLMLAMIFGMVLHITSTKMEEQSLYIMQSLHDRYGPKNAIEDGKRLPHFVVLVNHQGGISITSVSWFSQLDELAIEELVQQVLQSEVSDGLLKDVNLRYSRVSLPVGERIVFADTSMEQTTLKDLLKTCGLISAASLVVFFLISVALANWAVKPVEEAWKRQKQFVADASHELKTPLTVIVTNAELLQDPAYGTEEKLRFARSISAMSSQMRGLTEGLLNLTRVDSGVVATEMGEVKLSELVTEGLLPFEPIFFEKELFLESNVEGGITVCGSGPHLRQVLDILLDNASKYTDSPGTILVNLKRQGSHCLLQVSGPGQQISREDLKNIFRRFYRIDKAREMNRSYGLGLSIAESIVLEHRGRIWAESRNGINSFFVQLPIQLRFSDNWG